MDQYKLRPLSNRLVVKPDPPKDLSELGIHIPATAQEKPQIGTVISAGPGKMSEFPVLHEGGTDYDPRADEVGFYRMPMTVQEGDRVLFGKYSGTEVQIDRQKLLVIRETDVLSWLDREADGDS